MLPIAIHAGNGLEYEADGFVMLDLGVKPEVPDNYYLSKAYPNPFNAVTRLTYGMTEDGRISVRIFDLSGGLVSTLVDGTVSAGHHTVTWGADGMASGVYMVRMETAGFKSVRKVVLMR